jgi:hypothetical protein
MSPKFSMLPSQAISSDKSIRFSPLAGARSLTIRSWQESLSAKDSGHAGLMAIGTITRPLVVRSSKDRDAIFSL